MTMRGYATFSSRANAVIARSSTRHCECFALCDREIDVARLICAGQSNGHISRGLGIALRTVENHLPSVYAKAGVNSRTQLVSRLLGLN